MDSGGWQNVILPSAYGAPGDVIQQGIQNKERQNEKLLSLFQQREALKAKQQGEYGVANLKNLNDNTDAQKLLLGDRYANDVTAEELKKTYNELIGQVSNLDPVTFDYLLHGKVDEFNNWHNQFKQDFDYSKQKVADKLKKDPNLSQDQANEVVRSEFDNKYFKQDANGNWVRKSPEEVDMNKDPTAILDDPRMQGLIAIGGGDVIKKAIQADKLHQEDFSKYASNKGFVNSKSYNIGVSGLKEVANDANGEPVLKMKTEDFHLGDGVNLKMIPKDTFDAYMSDPSFKSAFYKLWNPVAYKIEKNFAQNGGELNKHSEDMLQRDFLRKYIEDNDLDLSFIQEKEKQVIPRPPVTNINIGDPASINNVYKTIDDKMNNDLQGGFTGTRVNALNTDAQNIIMDFARKTTGNQNISYSNIFLHKNNDGEIGIYRTTSGNDGEKKLIPSTEKLVGFLPKIGTNFKAQPGAAEKRGVIKEGNTTTLPPTQSKKKKYNPATGQFE